MPDYPEIVSDVVTDILSSAAQELTEFVLQEVVEVHDNLKAKCDSMIAVLTQISRMRALPGDNPINGQILVFAVNLASGCLKEVNKERTIQ
jgi:hypothetical protein